MARGILIVFKLPRKQKGLSMASACKLYRRLYGYNNSSYYGRYHTRVNGLLDTIPSIRYFNSVIIVKKEDSKKVISFLQRNNAVVHSWKVELSSVEARKLGLR